jgi:hypothetical protein
MLQSGSGSRFKKRVDAAKTAPAKKTVYAFTVF